MGLNVGIVWGEGPGERGMGWGRGDKGLDNDVAGHRRVCLQFLCRSDSRLIY